MIRIRTSPCFYGIIPTSNSMLPKKGLDLKNRQLTVLAVCLAMAGLAMAETVVDVTGAGSAKIPVRIDVANAAYASSLKRNLELSGAFVVSKSGAVTVTSGPDLSIRATGRGKQLTDRGAIADDASARMAARRFADAMCENYAGQKGFACDRIAFVSDKGRGVKELCACYPDGGDIRQLTSDGKIVVGPRWKDANTIFYTRYVNGGPEIWQLDTARQRREKVLHLAGLNTGAAVSPDGRRMATILSFQGNPELYVIDLVTRKWIRLTETKNASEGQPSWSPDGRKLVYVSDEARRPQLYVVDVATRQKRVLTRKGSQSVDPDWGRDGRIAYISKEAGQSRVAVIDPADGEGARKLVTEPGSWAHPSWARDGRHVVASRDKALFVVDVDDATAKPAAVFVSKGNWITPSWSK